MKKKGLSSLPLVAALLILIVGNLFWLDHWLDSDMAAEMIFSRVLSETGHFIASPDWYYSTEFRIAYTQLLMVPLFHVLSDWHAIRMIVNVVFYAMLLGSYLYLMKPAKLSNKTVILTAALLFVPFSETLAQHMHFGNTYLSHLILQFLVLGMILRLCETGESKKVSRIVTLVLLALLSLICGASGVRYLMSVYAPVLLTGIVLILMGGKAKALFSEKGDRPAGLREMLSRFAGLFVGFGGRVLKYGFLSTVIAMAGYGVNVTYVRSHYVFTTYETTSFVRLYKGIFYERLCDVFGCLMELFGYIPDKGVLSLRGLITMISFVLVIGVFLCGVRVMKLVSVGADAGQENEQSEEGWIRRFYPVFFFTSFGTMLFILMFTNTTLTARYFILPVFMMPAVLALYLEQETCWAKKSLFLVILCFSLILCEAKIMYSLRSADKNADRKAAAAYLVDQGYTFGFALYDDANLLQELTDGKVEAGAVVDPENLQFFRWSSAARYYVPEYHQGKVFFLLPEGKAETFRGFGPADAATEVYRERGYVIYSLENGTVFYDAQE